MKKDFLVEIGTEELPPKSLKTLMSAFTLGIEAGLNKAKLQHAAIRGYATPRRLAVLVSALDPQQADIKTERLGPAVAAAFDSDGKPTPPALGFAKGCGLKVEELEQTDTDKGPRLVFRRVEEGLTSEALLPDIVSHALKDLPIARRMRWGASRIEFVRPVHWVVMLFGKEVVPGSIMGLTSGRTTRGHRFHCNNEVSIPAPADYANTLRQAFVIADFIERRSLIEDGVNQLARNANGNAVIESGLLDEVTALNEWPVPLLGRFDEHFLEVPAEALISSMKEHQKYFHVVDGSDQLLPLFITVANIDSRDPSKVIAGNEKVIRPRLSDAAFFYKTDKNTTLEQRCEVLKNVVFQAKLGSVHDKSQRVAALAEYLAPTIGADPRLAHRAAILSKADLVTEMVQEFADLQGTMGRYYAQHDGEDEAVASALFEQYLPRFAGDKVASSSVGATLAIADRLDTLVGIFGIKQAPTGSKDPFALRRASLAVLRTLVEQGVDLDLKLALDKALSLHGNLTLAGEETSKQVLTYMLERFRSWYEEDRIRPEVFFAVMAKSPTRPLDIHRRVQAVNDFSQLPEARNLASANKRVSNILSKQGTEIGSAVDASLLQEAAEKALAENLSELSDTLQPLIADKDYRQILQQLAQLQQPVDDFFDQVMVMADDLALRQNRLAILSQLRALFLEVADVSLLASTK
ncbi:MAG: glycine--tRNA ligase subunit beta [Gammaproteobacteria bacterium]|nr:glycine--tRNA ligase subunit beta [Gammaproteobacteria bacterium]MBQ0839279.1 glycine--tRNA ligase subunit beta [Gammaproteobacteria bacterium]